jgi:hypothetical protein
MYLAALIAATTATMISAVFMVKSVREGDVLFSWAFAVVFVVSSLLTALYFWRTVL